MAHYRRLIGRKCYLSPVAAEDALPWSIWFNDLEVTLPLGDEAYVLQTLERQQQSIVEMSTADCPVFSIVDLETDSLIGRCLLFNVSQVNRSAQLGIVIGDKGYWGRGYGTDAIQLLLDHAFNLLNLNSVMLGVFEFNQRAIACYRRVGFREIGRRRQARIIAGKKYDGILMDILAEEFCSPLVDRLLPQNRESVPRGDGQSLR